MKVAILWLFHAIDRICIPNKTEDANINVFNMITRINESNKHKLIFTLIKQLTMGHYLENVHFQ